jgi:hypothetical protein
MSPDRTAVRKVSDTFSHARLTTAHRKGVRHLRSCVGQ